MDDGAETLGFAQRLSAVENSVYVPKFYDQPARRYLRELAEAQRVVRLGDLIDEGQITVSAGHEIGKMAYGTGRHPFVRTSDLANWEIKADPKQGVSQEIFDAFSARQDVSEGDMLFVRDGTYLIGTCALVSSLDEDIIFQSHVLKFRVHEDAPITAEMLLLAMSTPIVQRQIRSKQFTADIIDTIGNRYEQLLLPLPEKQAEVERISRRVKEITEERARLREDARRIPFTIENRGSKVSKLALDDLAEVELPSEYGSSIRSSQVQNGVYMPKYYSPSIEQRLDNLEQTHTFPTLGDLSENGVIALSTGDEVGKMAYGTGDLPFIRTSDFSNWELKSNPKQSISAAEFDDLRKKQDVRAGDIFLVRDGTYLVGSSCMVVDQDLPITYCGGMYRIRVLDEDQMDPFLLFGALNSPVARKQMRARQFTRDVIDTLGRRALEVKLPIPKSASDRERAAAAVRRVVLRRAELRVDLGREVEVLDPLGGRLG
ncbi:MAG: hypothetical protein QM648_00770 [Solirubrobacterales bacterium]